MYQIHGGIQCQNILYSPNPFYNTRYVSAMRCVLIEVIAKMSKRRTGLGSEHPYCDRIQNAMIILFLTVWGLDSLVLNYSTMLVGLVPLPLRLILSVLSLGIGVYFLSRSHSLALHEAGNQPKLADSGSFRWLDIPCILEH
jgi:hypothetical protein